MNEHMFARVPAARGDGCPCAALDAKRRIDAACGSDGARTPARSIAGISGAVSTLVSNDRLAKVAES